MTKVSVRGATIKDIPVLLGLFYELGRSKPQDDSDVEKFRNLVKKYITDSEKTIFVAILDGVQIIGAVSVMFLPRLNQTSHKMYIPELIVIEKFQNQGFGKKLIESCVSLARGKNCHRIRLESGNIRKKSHEFYKRLGFKQHALSFTKNLQ